jgi:hypothetical protein
MRMQRNLYRVKLRGMTSASISTAYGDSYVVASDPTTAYEIVKKYLDENNLGFSSERVLDRVELIAEGREHPPCKIMLFVQPIEGDLTVQLRKSGATWGCGCPGP